MTENAYTGHVEPHGESAVRSIGGLQIRKTSVGPMDNNAYLLTCRSSGAQLLIDAAAEPDRLRRLLAEGAEHDWLDLIVTTHSHHDHIGALEEMAAATGARTAAGAEDVKEIAAKIDLPLSHGDELRFGEQSVQIIALRGHTPGSIAVLWEGSDDDGERSSHLFTGDSLFPGGVGNTNEDPQRFAQLMDDVEQRLFDVLPDSTWVYPGHGDDTTLGAERPSLAQWRERGW
ncbi:MBL fold metallo-hydrolase [Brachybacterium alimentarium]|uniref:Zn-dependent hydrolase n=1 Tax=Brachybacterium alimentarium TaxID=47845 RepID=A0A2A3YM80_9MICO|nr:MBL fold metallo-hydrolase [Brachybacterium alimentarium]PCC40466.1 Zn-dependent hydrolase [Brachybacterium alimentarium]RCS78794.1 MBL fold metallo-hydrolase [Brachybacterium alimentarium]RCS93844.1 MBL fold metallo-hydrolase [Brachybacterium alimentarium]